MVRDYGNIPGLYAARLYINGMVAGAALEKTGGKTDDKDTLNRALRAVSFTDTPRGPFSFAIFVVIVVFMPEGLVPGTQRLWRWARAAASGPRVSAAG